MRWTRMSVVLASVAVLGCQVPALTPQQRAVEQQIVRDRFTAWTTALNNKELDSLLAMYDTDPGLSVAWPDGRLALGIEEQQAATQDFYNTVQYMNFVPQNPEVEVLSVAVAIVRFRHSMDLRYFDTRMVLFAGHGTLVWAKDAVDGVWRIHRQHISVNRSD